jgi:uncharacterized membrane protein
MAQVPIEFFTQQEEQEIIAAIKEAENNTSGEIRVHLERHTDKDHYERAKEVFCALEMDQTALRNGVLIYLALEDHVFYILGDKGINELVEEDFWDCTRDAMLTQFKLGNFKQGLIDGVLRAGERLKVFFPDIGKMDNELSDTISKS